MGRPAAIGPRRARLWAAWLAGCIVVWALPGWATEPCDCAYDWANVADGATGVPTNARIFLSWTGLDPATVSLTEISGTTQSPVDLSVEPAGAMDGQVWVSAEQALRPDTAYRLAAVAGGAPRSLDFTTGDGSDLTAPELGSVGVRGAPLAGACDAHVAAVLEPSAQADLETPADGLVFRLDVSGPNGSQAVFLHDAYLAFGDASLARDEQFQSCLQSVPGAQSGSLYSATVTVLDWASNPSPTSGPESFEFARAEPIFGAGGCSTADGTGSDPSTALWLGLCGLALLLRRR